MCKGSDSNMGIDIEVVVALRADESSREGALVLEDDVESCPKGLECNGCS